MYYWQNENDSKNPVIQENVKNMTEMSAKYQNATMRMFEVRIQPDSGLNFELPSNMGFISYFINKIPEFYVCECCGKKLPTILLNFVSGAYLCSDCEKEHTKTCIFCGQKMLDMESIFEKEHNAGYNLDSGCKMKYKFMVHVKNIGTGYICKNCKFTSFTECADCHKIILKTDSYTVNSKNLCKSCFDDNFTLCIMCRKPIKKEHSLNGLCTGCFMTKNGKEPMEIHNYTYKPDPVFISLKSGVLPFLACEIEMDKGTQTPELMQFLRDYDKFFYLKKDGSLSQSGFELVCYPMDFDFHKKFMKWGEIFKMARAAGFKSHDTWNCGLHVHMNRLAFGESKRNQSKYLAYFLWLIMANRAKIEKFCRRKTFDYCKFYNKYNVNGSITREYQKYVIFNQTERNLAVNFMTGRDANYHLCIGNTVEIRVFQGTLARDSLIATLALVRALNALVLTVKTQNADEAETEIRKITWNDIKNEAGSNCIEFRNYIAKMGL